MSLPWRPSPHSLAPPRPLLQLSTTSTANRPLSHPILHLLQPTPLGNPHNATLLRQPLLLPLPSHPTLPALPTTTQCATQCWGTRGGCTCRPSWWRPTAPPSCPWPPSWCPTRWGITARPMCCRWSSRAPRGHGAPCCSLLAVPCRTSRHTLCHVVAACPLPSSVQFADRQRPPICLGVLVPPK